MRTHVNTQIVDADGNTLIVANQEACVLSLENHRPLKLTALPYPKDAFPQAVFTEPFERFPSDFAESDLAFEQKIRSQHIDMSRHMNNIEYIKLALSVFTDDFLQAHELSDIEVHYTGESKEGQTLRVFKKTDGATSFMQIKESDRVVFEMKAVFREA